MVFPQMQTETTESFPIPESVEQIETSLGMVEFYQFFIHDFSKVALPLTKLLRKSIPFEWGADQEETFRYISSRLIDTPILRSPHFEQLFVITPMQTLMLLVQSHGHPDRRRPERLPVT